MSAGPVANTQWRSTNSRLTALRAMISRAM
jgi:hypothetical protein